MGGRFGKQTNKDELQTPKATSIEDFHLVCLDSHNEYRQLHGVPPLKLSKKLCQYSEEWAKYLAKKGKVEHREGCEYGENILCVKITDPDYTMTGSEPVDSWYSEIRNHSFGKEARKPQIDHFTQIVWRESRKLGVAYAITPRGKHIYVVANYFPAGNCAAKYIENVFPPGN